MAATAAAVEAAAETSAMETGMSKSASEAAAKPAVPTPATAPPAAPAPADRDPRPTPAPRITPTSPTPVGGWIIGVGSGITVAGVSAGITIVGVGARITIAGIALRRACRRRRRISRRRISRSRIPRRRISRIALRRRRGVAGINLCRSWLRKRSDAQGNRGKSGCSIGNSPEPAPFCANEHKSLHPESPETNGQRAICICHSDCHPPRRCCRSEAIKCHRSPHLKPHLRGGRTWNSRGCSRWCG
jgi:hypothetical protein